MSKVFNPYLKNTLTFVIFFAITLFYGQTNSAYSALQPPAKKSYWYNFNGTVKKVQTSYVYVKEDLEDHDYYRFRNNNDHVRRDDRFCNHIEFYINGQLQKEEEYGFGWTKKITSNYQYVEAGLKKKSLKKSNLKFYPGVFSNNLFLKLDYVSYSFDDTLQFTPVFDNFYKYMYDKKKRIKEELFYTTDQVIGNNSIPNKKTNAIYLYSKTMFYYNEKNQVIKQRFYKGLLGKSIGAFDQIYIGFLNEYITFKDTFLEARYQYDDVGRITQVALFEGEGLFCQEDYYYHPTKDYLQKAIYFSVIADFSGETKKSTRYYNENGDIVKREFLADYPEQILNKRACPRYYEYEYDKYNNWIKCTMYLQGTKEAGVTLISERKIEYYSETKK